MNNNWEHDDLWSLLGKAKPVRVSPFFSRNILREIRLMPLAQPLIPIFLLRWLGAGALAILTGGFFLNLDEGVHPMPLAQSADFAEVFDAVAGLDTLVVSEDVSFSTYVSDL
jgi:hypothetical protein